MGLITADERDVLKEFVGYFTDYKKECLPSLLGELVFKLLDRV